MLAKLSLFETSVENTFTWFINAVLSFINRLIKRASPPLHQSSLACPSKLRTISFLSNLRPKLLIFL